MPEKGSHEYPPGSIVITSQGVIMQGRPHGLSGKGKRVPPKGGKRGVISGWSKASRRRLREFLITHQPPEGYSLIGIDLTVPGPVLSKEDQRRLWHSFKNWLLRRGWPVVWRLEVQQRGAQHWHTVACVPDHVFGDPLKRAQLIMVVIPGAWLGALSKLPEVEHAVSATVAKGKRRVKGKRLVCLRRDHIPGADRRACVVKVLPDGKRQRSAIRYLYDHASKSKQAQIAQGLGRHWGVINRAAWAPAPGESLVVGDHEIRDMVGRWLRRLCTPRVPDPRAPFGRRLGWPVRRGNMGRSAWYTDPEIARAMVAHARSVVAWRKAERGET